MNVIHAPAHRQRGFSLLMSLVVLVVLTLSSLAMMLMMKGGLTAAGNIAFRQAATRVADVGVGDAITFVNSLSKTDRETMDTDDNGYHAWDHDTDGWTPLNHDWANDSRLMAGEYSGYQVRYVVHRMAIATGACGSDNCLYPASATVGTVKAGDSSDTTGYGAGATQSGLPYYRVTIKVVGPRFNNRYVQVFVY